MISTRFAWCVYIRDASELNQSFPLKFDTNGVTGGCQDIYTVIANTSSSFHPTCNNVTFPAGAMDVKAAVSTGSFSQYGWIDQVSTPLSSYPVI